MRTKKEILDELNKERSELRDMTSHKMDKRLTERRLEAILEQKRLVTKLEKEYIAVVSCIECKHLREVFCHPSNKDIGKGSIVDRMGWICISPETKGAVFFDNQYGYCEMFESK